MPNPQTFYSLSVVTTSTAAPSVNPAGEAMFGRPFIVRRENGFAIHTTTTVTDTAGTHVVTVTGHTQGRPNF